jgi:hypothetical protein
MKGLAYAVGRAGEGMTIFQKVDEQICRPMGMSVAVGTGVFVDHLFQDGVDDALDLGGTAQMGNVGKASKKIGLLGFVKAMDPVVNLIARDVLAVRCGLNGISIAHPNQRLSSTQNPSLVSGSGNVR